MVETQDKEAMMSASIGDFRGSWQISGATGPGSVLQNGGYILIGTGSGWGDSVPAFTESYQVTVGFALINNGQIVELSGVPLDSGGHEGQQPLLFLYQDGYLRWSGYYNQQPLRIFVSAADFTKADGTRYVAIYGTTIVGDPEQVGIWGGSGSPPPDPPDG
jgi:hypothetical protein